MRKTIEVKKPVKRRSRSRSVSKTTRSRSKSITKKPIKKRSTSKKKIVKKSIKRTKSKKRGLKGGTNITTAAIDTVNSVIGLGKSIGDEVNALMNMGSDFNRASNVKLPNDKSPDAFTSTTGQGVNPQFPKASV